MRRALHHAKNVVLRSTPVQIVGHQRTKSIINKLADALGLVYFGYVDQRDDEHRLVRGVTVSTTHDDHHYTVGTFQGYDVALVVRRDLLEGNDRKFREQVWTIVTVDMHTIVDMPHVYIANHDLHDGMVARLVHLIALPQAGDAFSRQFSLYGSMGQFIMLQSIFMQPVRDIIAKEFVGLSAEIHEGTIYVYADLKNPTRTQLERMFRCGIWLAQTIDATLYSPDS